MMTASASAIAPPQDSSAGGRLVALAPAPSRPSPGMPPPQPQPRWSLACSPSTAIGSARFAGAASLIPRNRDWIRETAGIGSDPDRRRSVGSEPRAQGSLAFPRLG